MYDSVYVPVDKLPISEDDKKMLRKEEFQTKDFDCELKNYHITDDGFLEKDEYAIRWDDSVKSGLFTLTGKLGGMVYENERKVRVDFHGDLYFYTCLTTNSMNPHPSPDWFGFIARFTNGKLEKITLIERH